MWGVIKTFLIVISAFYGIASCQHTEWWQAKEASDLKVQQERAIPKVYSQGADGCTVYTFHADNADHYFTRCPTTTTTDRNYTVQQGKSRVSRVEPISTEN